MKAMGLRVLSAGLLALSGVAAFGAARKPAPGRRRTGATHAAKNAVRPGPLVVGWHDEMNRLDQWTPLPPPNSPAIDAPTPGLMELSLTPKPAGFPYPYQWGGVRRIATVDLDRYPVLAVRALRLGPHTYWDVGVQQLKPGGGVVPVVKSKSETEPGVQFIDLGAAGLEGRQRLEIRLHLGGPLGGYEVADYGWVRFIRRQDRARVRKHPNPPEVRLDSAAAQSVTSTGVRTTTPAPRPGRVSGITLALMATAEGYKGTIGEGIQFSPDGRILANAAVDGVVIIRNSPSGTVLKTLPGQLAFGDMAVSFSPDGHLLAAPGARGHIKLWNTSNWSLWKELPGGAASLAFSPTGRDLAARLPDDSAVKIWNVNRGAVERVIPTPSFAPSPYSVRVSPLVEALCYTPDGSKLATAGADGIIRIWSPQTGALLSALRSHIGAVHCLRFSRDGRWLASAGEDQVVRLWPMDGGTPKVFGYATSLIHSIAFSRDGSVIAAGSERQIRFWRTADGEPLGLVNASGDWIHALGSTSGDWINALAFSPDGQTLAAGSRDGLVIFWRYSEVHG